jgi:hypothetical protein
MADSWAASWRFRSPERRHRDGPGVVADDPVAERCPPHRADVVHAGADGPRCEPATGQLLDPLLDVGPAQLSQGTWERARCWQPRPSPARWWPPTPAGRPTRRKQVSKVTRPAFGSTDRPVTTLAVTSASQRCGWSVRGKCAECSLSAASRYRARHRPARSDASRGWPSQRPVRGLIVESGAKAADRPCHPEHPWAADRARRRRCGRCSGR